MPDLKSALTGLGTVLTGAAMGSQGRGAEFAQGLQGQEQQRMQAQKEQEQEMLKNRAITSRVVLNSLQQGKPDQAFKFLSDVIGSGELQGKDKEDAVSLATMVRTGQHQQAMDILAPMDKQFTLQGLLPELAQAGGDTSKGFQFGATETYKDSEGNLFTATQKRNPATGKVEQVVVPVDANVKEPKGKLQEVGTYGLTAQEKLAQLGGEEGVKHSSKLVAEYKEQGVKARGLMRDTKRLLELNKLISTGKTAPATKAFMDLFNIKDKNAANLGEFNSKAGGLVLGMIKQLGANPTEGERAFLQQISPSLEQGTAVNDAILNDMLKIQERQFARAKWLVENPGKGVNDLLLLSDDFTPTSGQQEQPQTEETIIPNSQPQSNYGDMSDDDFLKTLR